MIYRKWSLLTGPPVVLGGVVATVLVGHFLFVEKEPFFKTQPKKPDAAQSAKYNRGSGKL